MQSYLARIRFICDYLQARMSDKAKSDISKTVKKSGTDDTLAAGDPKELMYFDAEGCFIPADQIRGAILESSKGFKIKKQRTNMRKIMAAVLLVKPVKIYMGKAKYDGTVLSFPKRKDGSRVPLIHPVFKAGLEVDFELHILKDDAISKSMLKEMLVEAGIIWGLGGRHPLYGRFEVIRFDEIKEDKKRK